METNTNKVVKAYVENKLPASKISHNLSIPLATVYATLISANIPRRKRGRQVGSYSNSGFRKIPLSDVKIIVDRYLVKKHSLNQISKDYGVSRQAIDSLLKTRQIHRDKIPFRKISSDKFDVVVNHFHKTQNISKVAKLFSVTSGVIVKILKSKNVAPDMYVHRLNLTKEQINGVINRYKAGEFAKNIAKDLDLRPHTIWSILHKSGVRREGGKPKKFSLSKYPEIKIDKENGMSVQDMASKYNLSEGGVKLILSRI